MRWVIQELSKRGFHGALRKPCVLSMFWGQSQPGPMQRVARHVLEIGEQKTAFPRATSTACTVLSDKACGVEIRSHNGQSRPLIFRQQPLQKGSSRLLSTRRPGLWLFCNSALCFKILSSPKSFIWNISINKFHQEQKFFICALGYRVILSHTISYSLFQQGLNVLISGLPGSQIWLKCSIYAHWIKDMLQNWTKTWQM